MEEKKEKDRMSYFFDFSNDRFKPREEKVRVVYVPAPTRQPEPISRSMNYSPQPQYRRVAPQPNVNVVKEIGAGIKAIKKFQHQRQLAKINEAKRLKKSIEMRLEARRSEAQIKELKRTEYLIKTAKQREAIAKAKELAGKAGSKIVSAGKDLKIKFGGSIYGKK